MKHSYQRYLVLYSLLAGSCVALLLPLPETWASGWRGECINRMHVPLIGICFVALEVLHRNAPVTNARSLLWAALSATLLAALVEIIQPWFHRTADLGDFLWGIAGIAAGALWKGAGMCHSLHLRVSGGILATILLLSPPLACAAKVLMASRAADRQFPVLTDFNGSLGGFFWSMEPEEDSYSEQASLHGHLILERTGQKAASAHLDARDRDWTLFDRLEIDGTLEASAAAEVGLRLDLDHKSGPRLRAGGWMTPGRHRIQIQWPDSPPPMQVHQMVVFLAAGEPDARLLIHQLRLLPRDGHASP